MNKQSQVKSMRFLVFSNQRGSAGSADLHIFEFPDERDGIDASPNESRFPIGVAYDHPHDVYGDGFNKNIVGQYLMSAVEESQLVGKLLTLCDATFTDREQRKAFKDMVSQTVYGFNREQEEKVKQTYLAATNN